MAYRTAPGVSTWQTEHLLHKYICSLQLCSSCQYMAYCTVHSSSCQYMAYCIAPGVSMHHNARIQVSLPIAHWAHWTGLCFVYIIYLFTFDSSMVLSLFTLYLCINTFSLHRNNNYNASKGGKPDRKPYHPCGFRNPYKTINKWRKLQFVHE